MTKMNYNYMRVGDSVNTEFKNQQSFIMIAYNLDIARTFIYKVTPRLVFMECKGCITNK